MCYLFSHEMSLMRSWTLSSRFLRFFLPTLTCNQATLNVIWLVADLHNTAEAVHGFVFTFLVL